jgi:hypothetical protein
VLFAQFNFVPTLPADSPFSKRLRITAASWLRGVFQLSGVRSIKRSPDRLGDAITAFS